MYVIFVFQLSPRCYLNFWSYICDRLAGYSSGAFNLVEAAAYRNPMILKQRNESVICAVYEAGNNMSEKGLFENIHGFNQSLKATGDLDSCQYIRAFFQFTHLSAFWYMATIISVAFQKG